MTIRVLLAEDFGFGGSGQVGVKNHQIVSALLGQLYQRVAVADTGSNFLISAIVELDLLFQRGVGGAQLGHSLGVFLVVGGLAVPIDGVSM